MDSQKDTAAISSVKNMDEQQQAKSIAEQEADILSIPLTNYSHHEIPIESKTDYSDALFADENELNLALIKGKETKKHTDSVPEHSKTTQLKEKPNTASVNFSHFLTAQPVDESNTSSIAAGMISDTDKLIIINNSLNNSNAKKPRATSIEAKQFNELFESLESRIQNEQLAKEKTALIALHEKKIVASNSQLEALIKKVKVQCVEIYKNGNKRFDKSKAEIEEYIGQSLPERILPLDFILPTKLSKIDSGELLTVQKINHLFSLKRQSLLSLLKKCDQQLHLVIQSQLSNNNKLLLLTTYLQHLSDRIQVIVAMYERKPVAYGDKTRSDIIKHASSTVKLLIIGYKQVYSRWYEASNLVYGTQRKKINECAFQLFDCLNLELKLSTSLHAQPSTSAIKTANKLFYVLSQYEHQWLGEQHYSHSESQQSSINTLFKHYQLTLFFQTTTISSTLHKALFAYFKNTFSLATLLPMTFTKQLPEVKTGQQLLVIEHDKDLPPSLVDHHFKHTSDQQDSIYILVQSLFNAIKIDFVNALKATITNKKEYRSNLPASSDHDQSLMMLAMLNQRIIYAESNQRVANYTHYQPTAIKAYAGFNSCYTYLKHHHAKLLSAGEKTQISGSELPSLPIASKAQWLSAGEDRDAIHLQVAESSLGIALDIGQLLLLVKNDPSNLSSQNITPESNEIPDSPDALVLTQVIRLQRDLRGALNITAIKLGNDMAQVTIAGTDLQTNTGEKPAIVIMKDKNRFIIVDNDHRYPTQAHLKVSFPDQQQTTVTIAGLKAINNDSQILQLNR